MMLEQVLDYIHNYFVVETHRGTYTIAGGSISLDFLQNGQYFRIIGSVFNDGIYQYPVDSLTDETFDGQIQPMAVPKSVIAIVGEIEDWVSKYGDKSDSPFQSESFGGYSYSKSSSGSSGKTAKGGWQNALGYKLNAWRKIS